MALRLNGAQVRWWVGGSCAAALRGVDVRPRDLDIECAVDDRHLAASALGIDLVREQDARCRSWRGAMTLAGVPVDMSVATSVYGPDAVLESDDSAILGACTPVEVCGQVVLLIPPEERLARSLALGDWRRLAKVASRGGSDPVDMNYVLGRLGCSSADE